MISVRRGPVEIWRENAGCDTCARITVDGQVISLSYWKVHQLLSQLDSACTEMELLLRDQSERLNEGYEE